MADVRIFSYLLNPRMWNAVIAARIGGVDLEVRGAAGAELVDWLWDFEVRLLKVHFGIARVHRRSRWRPSSPPRRPAPGGQAPGPVDPSRVGRECLIGASVDVRCEFGTLHAEPKRSATCARQGAVPGQRARAVSPRHDALRPPSNDPAFAPEFGPYLAKFTTERGAARERSTTFTTTDSQRNPQ